MVGGNYRQPSVMNTREVAEQLGVSTKTVIDLINTDELPAYRIRRQWRIKRSEFERWIEQRSGMPPPD